MGALFKQFYFDMWNCYFWGGIAIFGVELLFLGWNWYAVIGAEFELI